MSGMNRVNGTHRQALKSHAGEELQRGYLYLTPEIWDILYALTTTAGLPPSKYIAKLINAANGTPDTKETNDPQAFRSN